jgi:hypothetical protein
MAELRGAVNALLVMAKQPIPGQTKTRLTPPLSPQAAANLYEAFLRDTLDLMRQVPGVRRVVAYLPEGAHDYFGALAPDFELLPQQGLNLGERLDNSLSHYLTHGSDRAMIMDSDSPTLPAAYVVQAFAALESADGVIGPCDDGGYYLIGLRRPAPRLLREVQMSSPTVLRDTLAMAAAERLALVQLPPWYDVDTLADLHRLRAELEALPEARGAHTRAFLRTSFQA